MRCGARHRTARAAQAVANGGIRARDPGHEHRLSGGLVQHMSCGPCYHRLSTWRLIGRPAAAHMAGAMTAAGNGGRWSGSHDLVVAATGIGLGGAVCVA